MARSIEIRIGPQGPLLIPSNLRKKLNIQEGIRLMAKIENDCHPRSFPPPVKKPSRQKGSKIPLTVS